MGGNIAIRIHPARGLPTVQSDRHALPLEVDLVGVDPDAQLLQGLHRQVPALGLHGEGGPAHPCQTTVLIRGCYQLLLSVGEALDSATGFNATPFKEAKG